jgi:uncharacterized protein (DUF362 family)
VVWDGLRLLRPHVAGKRILLKPNLVEYSPSACINTHPTLIAAAAEALYRLGAQTVLVGDGPGHVRDTALLLEESGLRDALHAIGRTRFIDLNYDRVHAVPTQTALTTLDELWLPESLLAADIVISIPKIKTHHWAGVTLSLKNLFGAVPGAVCGWPKNTLHWQGIDNSIVELAATIPVHYVIADGIEAMEGNGPLHGPARHLGCIVFANDPLAADSACCSLMDINPYGIRHLNKAAPLSNLDPNQWDHLGEPIAPIRQTFQPPPGMAFGRIESPTTTRTPKELQSRTDMVPRPTACRETAEPFVRQIIRIFAAPAAGRSATQSTALASRANGTSKGHPCARTATSGERPRRIKADPLLV